MRNGGRGRPLNSIVRSHMSTIARTLAMLGRSLLIVLGLVAMAVLGGCARDWWLSSRFDQLEPSTSKADVVAALGAPHSVWVPSEAKRARFRGSSTLEKCDERYTYA